MNVSERRRLASVKERLQRNDCGGALQILQPLLPRKASPKAKATRARVRARKAAKSEKHRMSTKEIRAACMERADGRCEGCRCRWGYFYADKPQLDHWLSGSGQRRPRQSVATCWMLCGDCHGDRTRNWPSAEHWNRVHRRHCERNNVPFVPHIVHAQVPAPQAPGAVSGGEK